MSLQILFSSIDVYILVMVRFVGMIGFNPLFGRRNVPAMVRMGLVLFLTLLVAPMQSAAPVEALTGIGYVFAIFKELLVGIAYGYVFSVFFYMLYFAGDQLDTDFGIAMAKTFDPGTSIQTAFSTTIITYLFVMYFFASGAHLALIHMFASSFEQIPLGVPGLSTSVFAFVLDVFSEVFRMVLRIVAPFMVAEFILQASLGVLMKFIPQITIFVINFPLKIILAVLMLLWFAPYMGNFIDHYIDLLFDNMAVLGDVMAGG